MRHYLGLALYYTGDADGGRAMLDSIMRGDSPDIRAQASLASIEAASRTAHEARARIAEIRRVSELDHHVAYSLGAAFRQLGQPEERIEWLERAADTGFPCYPWFERDPLLDPIRQNPRFHTAACPSSGSPPRDGAPPAITQGPPISSYPLKDRQHGSIQVFEGVNFEERHDLVPEHRILAVGQLASTLRFEHPIGVPPGARKAFATSPG